MKNGYSILLGEYIDATALEYRDCEPFQIVCPECHEPLFKVARVAGDAPVQYLSHYRRGQSYDADCELRTPSKGEAERQQHNTESRNQRLAYFLKVLRDALGRDPYMPYGKGADFTHNQLNKAKALSIFKREHFEASLQAGDMADGRQFERVAQTYVKDIRQFGSFPITGFSVATQVRIASDVMKYLLTEPGRSNYYAVFNHAASYRLGRCQKPQAGSTEQDIAVLRAEGLFILGMIEGGRSTGWRFCSRWQMHRSIPHM